MVTETYSSYKKVVHPLSKGEGVSNEKIPYLYITGASYSGSTLLAFLLNAHTQMISVSEMGGPIESVVLEKYPCSCGTLLLECPFFLELEWRINNLGSSFSLRDWRTTFQLSNHKLINLPLARPLRNVFLEQLRDGLVTFWPGYRKTIEVINRRIQHFAQAALEMSGKTVFVDAQKDSIRVKFLQENQQLDFKVIHLVRDARGNVASYMKHTYANDVASAARAWYHTNMNSERARRYVSPDKWLRIRYEDLCADPQGAIDHISDFVGVKRSPILRNFYEDEHHILGNRMRLKGKEAGAIELDESWKSKLSQHDLDTIAEIAGEANRYFGHDWPQSNK